MSIHRAAGLELTRVAGPRRGALPAVAGVALLLVVVVGAGLLGGSGNGVAPAVSRETAADGDVSVSRLIAEAVSLGLRRIEASRPRPVGPPPPARDGRPPTGGSVGLRVLGWQTDPYQS